MKIGRRAKWGGLIVLPFLCLILFLLRGREPASFPLPSPNGYDDFLKASALLRGDWEHTNQDALRLCAAQNAQSFALVEAGLRKSCRVSVEVSKEYQAKHSKELGSLKHLTHCMIARAKLAEKEGRTNDALAGYLEACRFAFEMGRGGLGIDSLNSISCQALVMRDFSPMAPRLSSSQCSEALRVIEELEREREDPELVMRRERSWLDAAYGSFWRTRAWSDALWDTWRSRSMAPLNRLLGRDVVAERTTRYKTNVIAPLLDRLRAQMELPSSSNGTNTRTATEPLSSLRDQ